MKLRRALGYPRALTEIPLTPPPVGTSSRCARRRAGAAAHSIRGVSARSTIERLVEQHTRGLHLCVGLDTDPQRLPQSVAPDAPVHERVIAFNQAIIDATADLVCAYKPNVAFYEALGRPGFAALAATVQFARKRAPDAIVVIDAKRADIGSTNEGYVEAIFTQLGGDALTVHPYLGSEALDPFLQQRDRLIFVLARTSNPGAAEFQDLMVGDLPLYRRVARTVASKWNHEGNCGLVVGATYAEELEEIRRDVGADMPFLIPGVGAQGGDLEAVVDVHRSTGSNSFLINASRSVLYASRGSDFAEAARAEAVALDTAIRTLLDISQPE